jgi:phosphoglycerate kinase
MDIKTVKDVDVTSKRVLVRVDFNVPMDKDGTIRDDTRIRDCLPTIRYLIDKHAKVILAAHMGRPKGKVVESLRMAPVAKRLSELLGKPVEALRECTGPDVEKAISQMHDGDVVFLENLRFYPGEEKNDPAFTKALTSLADVYVNDAFSASHRAHSSVVGVTEFLPSVSGFLMEKELTMLSKLLENPAKPFAAVVGGAKVSDKLEVLDNIVTKVSEFIIGGGMAATFLKSEGYRVGKSIVEDDKLQYVRDLTEKARSMDVKLLLPTDVVIAENLDGSSPARTVTIGEIPDGWAIADIGPDTIASYVRELKGCKTVFWNGPMGIFEIPAFSNGTKEVAMAISTLHAITVVGGGSTTEAVNKYRVADKMSLVSTGGGATLEFLSGKSLPGVIALENASKRKVTQRS